jgi:hypothetical protein
VQDRILKLKLLGHFAYYGVIGTFKALNRMHYEVGRTWRYWLGHRSQRGRMSWPRFNDMLTRVPLPRPRIAHSVIAATAKP